jgi:serralysin
MSLAAFRDPIDAFATSADGLQDGHVAGCGCPVCSGRVQVVDTPPSEPLAFLNADERQGAVVNGKQSFTIDRAALQMTGFDTVQNADGTTTLVAQPGWGGVAGQAYTVTYAFRATAPAKMPEDVEGFQRFSPAQMHQAELSMQGWSDVANITFVRIGAGETGEAAYSDNASILLANYTSGASAAAAFAYLPGNPDPASRDGDVWINSTLSYNAVPVLWDYGPQVLTHELGHTIGLAHPGNYDAEEGVTITYQANAEYYEDSRQYTVMSYFGSFNTGASLDRFAAAPQLDDIRAAQIEYGANMTTRTGDTTYGFNSNADRPWFVLSSASQRLVFAVWDAGGTDTFDFSAYSNSQTIDLRAGYFSSVGGLVGNVAIAQGVTIENAIGGKGQDVIVGNALANVLWGGAGTDTINGAAGNDSIVGGEGTSLLRGDDGADIILGGAAFDDINGNMGDDILAGGDGDDWVAGGKDNDNLDGGAGSDVVYGNLGDDWCDGGIGDDQVRGGQGNDILVGREGNDWLSGDRGDDLIYGGLGADTFHAFAGVGLDIVMDFNLAEGDRVLLDPGTAYTVSQVGLDTVIDLSNGDRMVLNNVQLSSLTGAWILVG